MNCHKKHCHLDYTVFIIRLSNFCEIEKPSLCKGGWHTKCDGRIVKQQTIPQSATLTAPFTQGSLWKVASKLYTLQPQKALASRLYSLYNKSVEFWQNLKRLPCLKGGGPPKVVEGYKRGIWLIEKESPGLLRRQPPLDKGVFERRPTMICQ